MARLEESSRDKYRASVKAPLNKLIGGSGNRGPEILHNLTEWYVLWCDSKQHRMQYHTC